MNLQTNRPSTKTRKNKRAEKGLGAATVGDALPDVQVIHMEEVDSHAGALHAMVADAAYFRAEKRGFAAGHELEDWLAAEEKIHGRMQPVTVGS